MQEAAGEARVPRAAVAYKCSCTQVYVHACKRMCLHMFLCVCVAVYACVCALPGSGRQRRAGVSCHCPTSACVSECTCACVCAPAELNAWDWPCPCHTHCSASWCASDEGVGMSRGERCCRLGVLPSPDGVCFAAGCGRGSWLPAAPQRPVGISPGSCHRTPGWLGTPGAEHQGWVDTPRSQLSPTQPMPQLCCAWRRCPGSLPLKVTPSQCRCGYPASLHKEPGCLCPWGWANVGDQGVAEHLLAVSSP